MLRAQCAPCRSKTPFAARARLSIDPPGHVRAGRRRRKLSHNGWAGHAVPTGARRLQATFRLQVRPVHDGGLSAPRRNLPALQSRNRAAMRGFSPAARTAASRVARARLGDPCAAQARPGLEAERRSSASSFSWSRTTAGGSWRLRISRSAFTSRVCSTSRISSWRRRQAVARRNGPTFSKAQPRRSTSSTTRSRQSAERKGVSATACNSHRSPPTSRGTGSPCPGSGGRRCAGRRRRVGDRLGAGGEVAGVDNLQHGRDDPGAVVLAAATWVSIDRPALAEQ